MIRSAIVPMNASLLLLLLNSSNAEAQNTRPKVYIDEGACPSEGCSYGKWQVLKDTPLYSQPTDSAPTVVLVRAGTTVQALTGQVHTAPTPFVVKSDFLGAEGRIWVPGDTIWVVTYTGEGWFRVLIDGKLAEQDLGFSPYGGTYGTRCVGCSRGELARELRSTWWIKIQTPTGDVGWSRQAGNFRQPGS